MLLDDFKKLNLQSGQKIKVKYHPSWSKKEISKKWEVRESKETVLAPTKKELCLYNVEGGFLPVSSIKEITV